MGPAYVLEAAIKAVDEANPGGLQKFQKRELYASIMCCKVKARCLQEATGERLSSGHFGGLSDPCCSPRCLDTARRSGRSFARYVGLQAAANSPSAQSTRNISRL